MNYTEHLKELLKDITPINDNTRKYPDEETAVIDYRRNPLNPSLFSYCFKNILGFDVRYRIYEKVNYVIEFDYKGTYGYAAHQKLSFDVKVHRDYEQEILALFGQVRKVLSEYFLECGKEALADNKFTMENESYIYREKLDFYSERIEELGREAEALDEEQTRQVREAVAANGDWASVFNHFQRLKRKKRMESLYSRETYIDVWFSYLEHILTLLCPFTAGFDKTKSYSTHYIHNARWTWDKKLASAACGNEELLSYIEPLREIKEVYRNRSAHGMFSRELKVFAQIDGFGRYPMYLGKNYLKGLEDDVELSLDYEKYVGIKRLFDGLTDKLRQVYPVPMVFIDAGVAIPVDVTPLMEEVSTKEEAEYFARKWLYDMDNRLNMDW